MLNRIDRNKDYSYIVLDALVRKQITESIEGYLWMRIVTLTGLFDPPIICAQIRQDIEC